jgi:hypothetical protein
MDTSLFIGAPLGLGVLLALGILMVVMNYLSQCSLHLTRGAGAVHNLRAS